MLTTIVQSINVMLNKDKANTENKWGYYEDSIFARPQKLGLIRG